MGSLSGALSATTLLGLLLISFLSGLCSAGTAEVLDSSFSQYNITKNSTLPYQDKNNSVSYVVEEGGQSSAPAGFLLPLALGFVLGSVSTLLCLVLVGGLVYLIIIRVRAQSDKIPYGFILPDLDLEDPVRQQDASSAVSKKNRKVSGSGAPPLLLFEIEDSDYS